LSKPRCVIIGGAKILRYDRAKSAIKPDDFLIYCDGGLMHKEPLCAEPNLIVGDFDSHANPHSAVETIVLPCEKDDTDTVFAVKEAIKRGYTDFLLLGVVGERLDHTLANVSILLMLDDMGLSGRIIDDYSEMEIVSRTSKRVDGSFKYFSILNLSGTARGITETGCKYPLVNAEITCDYQYGVSNEVNPGEEAVISVAEGRLLLIKVYG
jgi:thiamine pyrophosphokinase